MATPAPTSARLIRIWVSAMPPNTSAASASTPSSAAASSNGAGREGGRSATGSTLVTGGR